MTLWSFGNVIKFNTNTNNLVKGQKTSKFFWGFSDGEWVDLDKKSRAACFLTKFCFRGAVPHQSMFYKTEIQGVKFPEDMVYLCCSKR